MKNKTVYIAGPMRGYAHFNYAAFFSAAAKCYALGATIVLNPAQMDVDTGFDARLLPASTDWHNAVPTDFDLAACVKRDLDAVMRADIVVTLDGYEHSTGASAEVAVAKWLKKSVVAISAV